MSNVFLEERLDLLVHWVRHRELARMNKEAGLRKPWSTDPIIQSTRFCCVRRMDDRVSRWLLDCWYPDGPTVSKGTILAAAGLARLINWPDALDGLRAPRAGVFNKWDRDRAKVHFEELKAGKQKVFTGAYIINAAGGGNKVDIVLRQIDTMYKHPEPLDPSSMQQTHALFQRIPGIGSFIAGQIVADLRHVWPGTWADKDVWAPLGPGSRRGVAWLMGWDGKTKLGRLPQGDFEYFLRELARFFNSELLDVMKDRKLEMHDLQNCLCEYDKWMRLRNGTGRAKNKFDGV